MKTAYKYYSREDKSHYNNHIGTAYEMQQSVKTLVSGVFWESGNRINRLSVHENILLTFWQLVFRVVDRESEIILLL